MVLQIQLFKFKIDLEFWCFKDILELKNKD